MSSTEPTESNPPPRSISGPLKFLLVLVVLGLALGFGGRYYVLSLPFESTDDAFIEGDVIAISPQVSGQVLEVLVNTNQEVKKGDLLFTIDPEYYREQHAYATASVRLAESRKHTAKSTVALTRITTGARLQQVEAELTEAEAVLEESRVQVEAAGAEAIRTEQDYERHREEDESIFSQRETDLALSLTQIAKAVLEKSKKQVLGAEAAVGVVLGRLADARSGPQLVKVQEKKVNEYAAEIEVARAALNRAALDLEHTKVYAPCDGRVTRKSIDVGEQVQVGRFLMAIVSKEVWVEANFRETQLTDMRVGQSVEIRVDTYPGRVFVGHVESIQAGTGSRFSLLPPQNATGNYVKVVQRVPVKILFDELPEDDLLLVPGMSVIPKVRVR